MRAVLFHSVKALCALSLGGIAVHQYHDDPCLCHTLASAVAALGFACDLLAKVVNRPKETPPLPPAPGNWEVMRYDERDVA